MDRTTLLPLALAFLAVSAPTAAQAGPATQVDSPSPRKPDERPPNFVVIVADDCTWSDLGCYGGQARTPNLDALCASGMRFDRCFQSAPMCSPTRHALYTGQHPVRTGAYPNHTFAREGTRSVAHFLGDAGYRVALWNKSHVNPPSVFPWTHLKAPKNKRARGGELGDFVADAVAADEPFCVFVCSNEPHAPWTRGPADSYDPATLDLPPVLVDTPRTRADYARYLAEITFFDTQVGDCMALLDRHAIADDTVVIVLGEQGNSFPYAKWTCYEAGLRSGMVVRWPGHVAPGSTTTAIVQYVDVVPTMLAIVGTKPPDDLDGRSFLRVLAGESDTHGRYAYGLQTTRGIIDGSEAFGIRTVRDERFRYIRNLHPDERFQNVVMRGPMWAEWVAAAGEDPRARALVDGYVSRPAVELYDAEADPWCRRNLADEPEFAAVQARLAAALDAWMEAQGDAGDATERSAHERQWRNRNK